MTRRLLFVRAVNVGGVKLPMADFRELLTELGGTNVQTYIASGNAIVDVRGNPDAYDRSVEQAMQDRFGWFREVISRTPAEAAEALQRYPFEVIEPRFSYIVFLATTPAPDAITAARQIDTGDDQWEAVGREIHLQYANGAGQANRGVDKALRKLNVPGTARNLNTVRKLIELATSP